MLGIQRRHLSRGRPMISDEQSAFAGGVNVDAEPQHLAATEFRRALNARLLLMGAVQKRGGTQRIHGTVLPGAVRGGSLFALNAGSALTLLVANGTLYRLTYGALPITPTAYAGALSATVPPSFAKLRDGVGEKMYIADGGLLNKCDAAVLTVDIAGSSQCRKIVAFNRRLLGISGTDNILHASALDNGDSLGNSGAGGGQFAISTFGSMEMKTLLVLGPTLCMIHRAGVSLFTGWDQDDFRIGSGAYGLSTETGTIADRSALSTETFGAFLSENGFYGVDGNGLRPIGPRVETLLRGLDQSTWDQVVAVHQKAYYEFWWSLPGLGTLVYNYRLDRWAGPFEGLFLTQFPTALIATVDEANRPIVLFGGPDGWVRRTDAPGIKLDDVRADGTLGDRFPLAVQLRRLYGKSPISIKRWYDAFLHADFGGSDRVSVLCETDSGSEIIPVTNTSAGGRWDQDAAEWDALSLGGDPPFYWGNLDTARFRVPLAGIGPYTDLTIIDDGETQGTIARVDVRAHHLGVRA